MSALLALSALGARCNVYSPNATPTTVVVRETAQPPIRETAVPPTVAVTAAPTEKPAPSAQLTFTRGDVDAVLGEGNWECFPDRVDGVAVHNLPDNGIGVPDGWEMSVNVFVIKYPISAVDKGPKFVHKAPASGGATAWLAGTLASRLECPPPPEQSVVIAQPTAAPSYAPPTVVAPRPVSFECTISKFGSIYYIPPEGDSNLGRMVKIEALEPFTVPAGWTVDNPTGKFSAGKHVSVGKWSVWAPEACYGKIK